MPGAALPPPPKASRRRGMRRFTVGLTATRMDRQKRSPTPTDARQFILKEIANAQARLMQRHSLMIWLIPFLAAAMAGMSALPPRTERNAMAGDDVKESAACAPWRRQRAMLGELSPRNRSFLGDRGCCSMSKADQRIRALQC